MIETLALFLLATVYAAGPTDAAVEAARAWRGSHAPAILREYAEFLSLANVTGDVPALRRNASFIRDELAQRGVEAELLERNGAAPIVMGVLRSPGSTRTFGVYAHYDGQPVDPASWTTPPFEAALVDGSLEAGGAHRPMPRDEEAVDPQWRLYARGAGDDKAPIAAILSALDALGARTIPITSNIVFFFEGEEESGSRHLGEYLERARPTLQAVDLWLICDGPVHQTRHPQLVFGARGVTSLELTVYGAGRPLHSGHYGNWAPNPAMKLARLLASMKDESGRVLIDGFYDSVEKAGAAERAAMARIPEIGPALREELGLANDAGSAIPYAEGLMAPSLNIRGLTAATTGETARNIVPSRATASIDIRLVKGEAPGAMLDLVEKHLERHGWFIVREEPTREDRLAHANIVKVTRGVGYRAVRTAMDLPVVAPVIESVRRASGEAPILMPTMGGSLPLYLFEDVLAQAMVIVPIANHDDNQHAPDENIRLANLWYGIDLFAAILTAD